MVYLTRRIYIHLTYILVFALVCLVWSEQSDYKKSVSGTPAAKELSGQPSKMNQINPPQIQDASEIKYNSIAAIGDTITFEEYGTGTVITDQYLSEGIIFSGLEAGQNPVIHDYGESTHTSTLHSYDWFGALVVHFVNPENSEEYRNVRHISFDNPIDTEVDYISIAVYDAEDLILYQSVSTSPERVTINLENSPAAYMVLDDSANTAYVIDNLTTDSVSTVSNISEKFAQHMLPAQINLEQNYPNPFNPSTRINYSLPKSDLVNIIVYDSQGREVDVLVNEFKNQGSHTIEFDGSGLSSGIYYYRVQAGNFINTKKMILMK